VNEPPEFTVKEPPLPCMCMEELTVSEPPPREGTEPEPIGIEELTVKEPPPPCKGFEPEPISCTKAAGAVDGKLEPEPADGRTARGCEGLRCCFQPTAALGVRARGGEARDGSTPTTGPARVGDLALGMALPATPLA